MHKELFLLGHISDRIVSIVTNKFRKSLRIILSTFVSSIGADWFRQQDQWVSKHAENRSAISLIPCCTTITGNQEFALAA